MTTTKWRQYPEEYYHVVLKRIPPQASPPFEDPDMQVRVWGQRWGCTNDVGRLRLVLLHRPGPEMKVIDSSKYDPEIDALIDDDEQWYFRSDTAPDLERMQAQHDKLAQVLRDEGVQVEYVDGSPRNPKAIYTRDTAIAVNGGAIICRMGPVGKYPGTGRRGEEAYVTRKIASLGMPILRTIHGTGLFEGGSFCFLNERNAAVGMSYRQNEEAVRQIEEVLAVQGVKVHRVPLVGHSLHLDGCIVMVDVDVALIRITRLPYWFLDLLKELGIRTVEVHPEDDPRTVNCLAVRPGRVIMCTGSERTQERLAKLGIEVIPIEYDEVHKGGGGIHCSTLPLVRDPIS
ncbi:MAG TPA: arginine deiminase family protein [Limnochordales bacterium]